jgi:UDP-N-acetylglucosamine enolpyruvyl transferase
MMAAVLADGVTVIEGAACEPEVVDLANFLNKMGAKIEGAGTDRIIIEGVRELHGAEHRVIPDRIEAGTFLVAGAIAGDGVTVKRVEPEHVRAVTDALAKCGYAVDIAFPSCPTAMPARWKSLRNRILVSRPTCRRKCARYFRRTGERVQLLRTFFRSVICMWLS